MFSLSAWSIVHVAVSVVGVALVVLIVPNYEAATLTLLVVRFVFVTVALPPVIVQLNLVPVGKLPPLEGAAANVNESVFL